MEIFPMGFWQVGNLAECSRLKSSVLDVYNVIGVEKVFDHPHWLDFRRTWGRLKDATRRGAPEP